MSRYIQLTVAVRPNYPAGLEESYPTLARHWEHLYSGLVQGNHSLYELVGMLDHLLYRFERTKLREVLLRRRDALLSTHKTIQKNIADYNLSQADRLLYGIEDAFDEIESELD